MKAKKCDRCNKFYETNNDAGVQLTIDRLKSYDFMYYDLCDECAEKLIKFLELEEKNLEKDKMY